MPRAAIPDRANVILDHARAVILEKGYQRATIADIAQRAAVGKGAVYLDFASKKALLDALLVRSARSLAGSVRARVLECGRPVTLSMAYRFGLDALLADELMLAFYLTDSDVLGGYLREQGPDRYRPRLDWLTDYVDALRQAGLLRGDVDPKAASLLMSVFAVGLANASAVLGPLSARHLGEAVDQMTALIAAGWERTGTGTGTDPDPAAAQRAHTVLLDRLEDQMGPA